MQIKTNYQLQQSSQNYTDNEVWFVAPQPLLLTCAAQRSFILLVILATKHGVAIASK
jgi:hypothetical protein